jgi:SAM-dependent methyltransferase
MGGWDWHTGSELGASAPDLYERYLVPVLFGPWADDLVALADLRGRERVLDLACGTGVVARRARAALAEGGVVVGADINKDMLRVARAHSADLAIEWREADARALQFDDHDFDVVFCQQGLQFVPDRVAALSEIGRVLGTGGRAVLAVWTSIEDSRGFDALANAIGSHLGAEAAAGLRQGPFGYDPRMTSSEASWPPGSPRCERNSARSSCGSPRRMSSSAATP